MRGHLKYFIIYLQTFRLDVLHIATMGRSFRRFLSHFQLSFCVMEEVEGGVRLEIRNEIENICEQPQLAIVQIPYTLYTSFLSPAIKFRSNELTFSPCVRSSLLLSAFLLSPFEQCATSCLTMRMYFSY